MPAGGNSGVHLRCTDRLAGPGNGMEVQVIDEDDERGRGLPSKARTGAIWGVVGPAKRATLGPGRWNTLEVTCRCDLPRSGFIGLENIRGQGRGVEYRAVRVEGLD